MDVLSYEVTRNLHKFSTTRASILSLFTHFITSTTEGEGGYVFSPFSLFVCLSVCLCAGYLKKLWTDLDETWWTSWVCDEEELVQF